MNSLSERANTSSRCIFSYPPDFVCLPLPLPEGFSCLHLTRSALFLSAFKQEPLHTANHFYCPICTLCLLSNRVGEFIELCRAEQGGDVLELTLMENLIGQWFQFKLQCHSWSNVRTHFTTYYKRKTTQQQKLITLWMLPWEPFTLTGSAGYWMFSSHWAEIIWCFAGRVGLLGSQAPSAAVKTIWREDPECWVDAR